MHIYIDESGSFIIPKSRKPKVSCVAALVIPSSKNEEVLNEFIKISSAWGLGTDEIKGSKLDEARIAEIISFEETCAEIARVVEQMRKDQAEIDQLKTETRAMLEKLKAA
ncbi:MAG: hypothetical protein WBV94_02680 [Blastocatellia bacterium]